MWHKAGAAVAAILWCGAATAADRAVVFELDNDLFSGSDRHYTNGIRFTGLFEPSDESSVVRWVDRNLPFLGEGERRAGITIGQSIFTPQETGDARPIPNDRPYAGWLFVDFSYAHESLTHLAQWQLSLGLVGPQALGEEAQNFVHRIRGFPDAKGWDNQLKNEPALVLAYDHIWKGVPKYDFGVLDLTFDVSPSAGFALGNVFTYGAAGVTFRFGTGLDRDTAPAPGARPGQLGASQGARPGPRHFDTYLFAGVEARAIARNIFLDGNTFRESPSVDKVPLVGELRLGFVTTFEFLKFSYTHVFRTHEFQGQNGIDRYGAVSLTLLF
jgi:lipid A 3-O-deacylase